MQATPSRIRLAPFQVRLPKSSLRRTPGRSSGTANTFSLEERKAYLALARIALRGGIRACTWLCASHWNHPLASDSGLRGVTLKGIGKVLPTVSEGRVSATH